MSLPTSLFTRLFCISSPTASQNESERKYQAFWQPSRTTHPKYSSKDHKMAEHHKQQRQPRTSGLAINRGRGNSRKMKNAAHGGNSVKTNIDTDSSWSLQLRTFSVRHSCVSSKSSHGGQQQRSIDPSLPQGLCRVVQREKSKERYPIGTLLSSTIIENQRLSCPQREYATQQTQQSMDSHLEMAIMEQQKSQPQKTRTPPFAFKKLHSPGIHHTTSKCQNRCNCTPLKRNSSGTGFTHQQLPFQSLRQPLFFQQLTLQQASKLITPSHILCTCENAKNNGYSYYQTASTPPSAAQLKSRWKIEDGSKAKSYQTAAGFLVNGENSSVFEMGLMEACPNSTLHSCSKFCARVQSSPGECSSSQHPNHINIHIPPSWVLRTIKQNKCPASIFPVSNYCLCQVSNNSTLSPAQNSPGSHLSMQPMRNESPVSCYTTQSACPLLVDNHIGTSSPCMALAQHLVPTTLTMSSQLKNQTFRRLTFSSTRHTSLPPTQRSHSLDPNFRRPVRCSNSCKKSSFMQIVNRKPFCNLSPLTPLNSAIVFSFPSANLRQIRPSAAKLCNNFQPIVSMCSSESRQTATTNIALDRVEPLATPTKITLPWNKQRSVLKKKQPQNPLQTSTTKYKRLQAAKRKCVGTSYSKKKDSNQGEPNSALIDGVSSQHTQDRTLQLYIQDGSTLVPEECLESKKCAKKRLSAPVKLQRSYKANRTGSTRLRNDSTNTNNVIPTKHGNDVVSFHNQRAASGKYKPEITSDSLRRKPQLTSQLISLHEKPHERKIGGTPSLKTNCVVRKDKQLLRSRFDDSKRLREKSTESYPKRRRTGRGADSIDTDLHRCIAGNFNQTERLSTYLSSVHRFMEDEKNYFTIYNGIDIDAPSGNCRVSGTLSANKDGLFQDEPPLIRCGSSIEALERRPAESLTLNPHGYRKSVNALSLAEDDSENNTDTNKSENLSNCQRNEIFSSPENIEVSNHVAGNPTTSDEDKMGSVTHVQSTAEDHRNNKSEHSYASNGFSICFSNDTTDDTVQQITRDSSGDGTDQNHKVNDEAVYDEYGHLNNVDKAATMCDAKVSMESVYPRFCASAIAIEESLGPPSIADVRTPSSSQRVSPVLSHEEQNQKKLSLTRCLNIKTLELDPLVPQFSIANSFSNDSPAQSLLFSNSCPPSSVTHQTQLVQQATIEGDVKFLDFNQMSSKTLDVVKCIDNSLPHHTTVLEDKSGSLIPELLASLPLPEGINVDSLPIISEEPSSSRDALLRTNRSGATQKSLDILRVGTKESNAGMEMESISMSRLEGPLYSKSPSDVESIANVCGFVTVSKNNKPRNGPLKMCLFILRFGLQAHVIQLDVDDTLIPTSQFCERDWLDKDLDDLPRCYREKLATLDQQLTRLFDLLHHMVVHEDILVSVPDESAQLNPGLNSRLSPSISQMDSVQNIVQVNDNEVLQSPGQARNPSQPTESNSLVSQLPATNTLNQDDMDRLGSPILCSVDSDISDLPKTIEQTRTRETLSQEIPLEKIVVQPELRLDVPSQQRKDEFQAKPEQPSLHQPRIIDNNKASACPSLPLWKALGSRDSPFGVCCPSTATAKPLTPRGVIKQRIAVSTEPLEVGDDNTNVSENAVNASSFPSTSSEIITQSDIQIGGRAIKSQEMEPTSEKQTFITENVPRNYLLSVVIVTNATMSHIRTVFPKFLPTLTAFFQEKQIYLDDLVCSARDLWSDEFPFEHFYDFWKCWTLEDVLNQLRHDGVNRLTVLSIGDDEPERKAAAYVRREMPELVRGIKLIKMVGHPDINEISIQLEYLIHNLRGYIHRTTPFDVSYKLEDAATRTYQFKVLDAIKHCNLQSKAVQSLGITVTSHPAIANGSIAAEIEEDGKDIIPKNNNLCSTNETIHLLDNCISEVSHQTPPDPPNPFEAALIQFELKFEQFHTIFSQIQALEINPCLRHDTTLNLSTSRNQNNGSTVNDSNPSDAQVYPMTSKSVFSASPHYSLLADAARNRLGLQDCVLRHVTNLIETNRTELIFLGRDCVSFLNQIQENLPTILTPELDEGFESEESGLSLGTGLFDHDEQEKGPSATSDSSDILLGLVHNVVGFLLLYPTMFLEFTKRDHQAITACVVHVIVDVLCQHPDVLPVLSPLTQSPSTPSPTISLNSCLSDHSSPTSTKLELTLSTSSVASLIEPVEQWTPRPSPVAEDPSLTPVTRELIELPQNHNNAINHYIEEHIEHKIEHSFHRSMIGH